MPWHEGEDPNQIEKEWPKRGHELDPYTPGGGVPWGPGEWDLPPDLWKRFVPRAPNIRGFAGGGWARKEFDLDEWDRQNYGEKNANPIWLAQGFGSRWANQLGGLIGFDGGGQAYSDPFGRNAPWATGGRYGSYRTPLTPQQETAFRQWVRDHKVPFNPDQIDADYDMRGFWLNGAAAGYDPNTWKRGQHFPDTWKTPYHKSFSSDSMYAIEGTPFVWQGDTLIDTRTGEPVPGAAVGGWMAGTIWQPEPPTPTHPYPLAPGSPPLGGIPPYWDAPKGSPYIPPWWVSQPPGMYPRPPGPPAPPGTGKEKWTWDWPPTIGHELDPYMPIGPPALKMQPHAGGGLIGFSNGDIVQQIIGAGGEKGPHWTVAPNAPPRPGIHPNPNLPTPRGPTWPEIGRAEDRAFAWPWSSGSQMLGNLWHRITHPFQAPRSWREAFLGFAGGGVVGMDGGGWLQDISDFGTGAGESLMGLVHAIAHPSEPLRGIANLLGSSWMAAAGVEPPEGEPTAGEQWKQFGKGLLHWDEWAQNPAKALGASTFDVITAFLPLKGLSQLAKSGKAGSAAEAAVDAAGEAAKAQAAVKPPAMPERPPAGVLPKQDLGIPPVPAAAAPRVPAAPPLTGSRIDQLNQLLFPEGAPELPKPARGPALPEMPLSLPRTTPGSIQAAIDAAQEALRPEPGRAGYVTGPRVIGPGTAGNVPWWERAGAPAEDPWGPVRQRFGLTEREIEELSGAGRGVRTEYVGPGSRSWAEQQARLREEHPIGSAERRQLIRNMLNEGLSIRSIAETLAVSRGEVAAEMGLTPEEIEELGGLEEIEEGGVQARILAGEVLPGPPPVIEAFPATDDVVSAWRAMEAHYSASEAHAGAQLPFNLTQMRDIAAQYGTDFLRYVNDSIRANLSPAQMGAAWESYSAYLRENDLVSTPGHPNIYEWRVALNDHLSERYGVSADDLDIPDDVYRNLYRRGESPESAAHSVGQYAASRGLLPQGPMRPAGWEPPPGMSEAMQEARERLFGRPAATGEELAAQTRGEQISEILEYAREHGHYYPGLEADLEDTEPHEWPSIDPEFAGAEGFHFSFEEFRERVQHIADEPLPGGRWPMGSLEGMSVAQLRETIEQLEWMMGQPEHRNNLRQIHEQLIHAGHVFDAVTAAETMGMGAPPAGLIGSVEAQTMGQIMPEVTEQLLHWQEEAAATREQLGLPPPPYELMRPPATGRRIRTPEEMALHQRDPEAARRWLYGEEGATNPLYVAGSSGEFPESITGATGFDDWMEQVRGHLAGLGTSPDQITGFNWYQEFLEGMGPETAARYGFRDFGSRSHATPYLPGIDVAASAGPWRTHGASQPLLQRDFFDWRDVVNDFLGRYGIQTDDLPDHNWRQAFDRGDSPAEAARDAMGTHPRYAGLLGTEGTTGTTGIGPGLPRGGRFQHPLAGMRQGPEEGYQEIVFLQGEDYDEIAHMGYEEMLEHLLQWDYGEGGGEIRTTPGASSDQIVDMGNGLFLTINHQLGYAGLSRRVGPGGQFGGLLGLQAGGGSLWSKFVQAGGTRLAGISPYSQPPQQQDPFASMGVGLSWTDTKALRDIFSGRGGAGSSMRSSGIDPASKFSAETRAAQNPFSGMMQTGGEVPGAPWPGRDSVPMGLQAGSYVIRRDQALLNRGLIDSIMGGSGGAAAGASTMIPAMVMPQERIIPPKIAADNMALLDAINYGKGRVQSYFDGGLVEEAEEWAAFISGQPYNADSYLDCSGYVSSVWGVMSGYGPGRHFSTDSIARDWQRFGFHEGYLPGAFNIAVNPAPGQEGHMIAQLPNGVIIESGGPGGGIVYGSNTSMNASQFTRHFYWLPPGGQNPLLGTSGIRFADYSMGLGGTEPADFTAGGGDGGDGSGGGPGGAGSPGAPGANVPPPPPGLEKFRVAPGAPGAISTPWGTYAEWADLPSDQQAKISATERKNVDEWLVKYKNTVRQGTEDQDNVNKASRDLAEAKQKAALADKAYDDYYNKNILPILQSDLPEAQKQEIVRARMQDATYKQLLRDKERADNELITAEDRLRKANDRVSTNLDQQRIEMDRAAASFADKAKRTTPDENAAALGAGLIKGMAQELGFPDVFGKPPWQWGIWKLFAGGAGYALGLLNRIGEDTAKMGGGPGGPAAAGLGGPAAPGAPVAGPGEDYPGLPHSDAINGEYSHLPLGDTTGWNLDPVTQRWMPPGMTSPYGTPPEAQPANPKLGGPLANPPKPPPGPGYPKYNPADPPHTFRMWNPDLNGPGQGGFYGPLLGEDYKPLPEQPAPAPAPAPPPAPPVPPPGGPPPPAYPAPGLPGAPRHRIPGPNEPRPPGLPPWDPQMNMYYDPATGNEVWGPLLSPDDPYKVKLPGQTKPSAFKGPGQLGGDGATAAVSTGYRTPPFAQAPPRDGDRGNVAIPRSADRVTSWMAASQTPAGAPAMATAMSMSGGTTIGTKIDIHNLGVTPGDVFDKQVIHAQNAGTRTPQLANGAGVPA
jgi:hypothetical protein